MSFFRRNLCCCFFTESEPNPSQNGTEMKSKTSRGSFHKDYSSGRTLGTSNSNAPSNDPQISPQLKASEAALARQKELTDKRKISHKYPILHSQQQSSNASSSSTNLNWRVD